MASVPPSTPLPYRGRFAPSPTGPLHLGSLVAAMASWLDARSHLGAWLVRIEDIDPPREVAGASAEILATLSDFGFVWDEAPLYQSQRSAAYQLAFDHLVQMDWIYPCACTRKEIADTLGAPAPGTEEMAAQTVAMTVPIYPGTCRNGLAPGRSARAWRMRIEHPQARHNPIHFTDRQTGPQQQDLSTAVGDFVLKRADGLWAYQLAVVVDDAAQGITDVVRGADLLDSTARQVHLQRALGLPTPRYLHVPLVTNACGEKLSKQTGAVALNRQQPLVQLRAAMRHLGLSEPTATTLDAFWLQATALWGARWQVP